MISLAPVWEFLILGMLSGIILTGLLNVVSALSWDSIPKANVALSTGVSSVKSLDFDRDRQVFLAHSWPNDLCEIHLETGIVSPIQVPPSPIQIALIATSQRNSTKIMVTESTGLATYPKRIFIVRGDELIFSQDVPVEMTAVSNVDVSSDGTIAELTSDDGSVLGFDLSTENPHQWKFNVGHTIFADRMSPDGRWLFAADGEENSFIYDLQTGKRTVKVHINRGCSRTALWSRDSKRLAVSDNGGGVYVVDPSDGQIVWSRKMEFLFARSLAISDDGRLLAASGLGNKIYIWDLSTSAITPSMVIKVAGVGRNMQFTDGGKSIVSGNEDGSINEWSLVTCQMVRKFR